MYYNQKKFGRKHSISIQHYLTSEKMSLKRKAGAHSRQSKNKALQINIISYGSFSRTFIR
jgi:hypothetical protein